VNKLMAREMRIRDGCKTMLRAINKVDHPQQRQLVKQQLAVANANVAALNSELQSINSDFRLGSALAADQTVPDNAFPVLVPGLKEATPVGLHRSFSAFVGSHYHESATRYSRETTAIDDARERMREAPLSVQGRTDVLGYFAKLLQAEHRFFQEDKCGDVSFSWFDSFDGQVATSKSIRLEKGSVLYNAAAMSAQLAAVEDYSTHAGLEAATEHFQHAAGILQYIREENFFKSAISTDLTRSTLNTLSILMLAQAQECIWHKLMLGFKTGGSNGTAATAATPASRPDGAEAAAVAEWYASARESLATPLHSKLPKGWAATIEAKEALFRGIADWHTGSGEMVHQSKSRSIAGLAKVIRSLESCKQCTTVCERDQLDSRIASVAAEYTAVVSMVLGRVSPAIVAELTPKVAQIAPVHGKAVRWSTGVCDLINACIQGEEDLFADMGPVYFFNSMCALVERRTHTMEWRPASLASYSQHYGMTTSGGNPVRIADVQYRSAAQAAGVRAGDYIIAINEVDARGMVTTEVDQLLDELHAAKAEVVLTVVVNYDMQNFEELINPEVAAPTTSRAGAGGGAGGAASAGGAGGADGAGGAGANRSEKVPMPVVWGKSTFNLKGNSSMNLLMSDAC
jgi:hypothetical protein